MDLVLHSMGSFFQLHVNYNDQLDMMEIGNYAHINKAIFIYTYKDQLDMMEIGNYGTYK